MKSEFTGKIEQITVNGEKHSTLVGDSYDDSFDHNIHDFLKNFDGRRVKITVETLDEKPPEDMVTVTYKELFKRVDGDDLTTMGVSVWYLNTGGDPDAIKDIPKSHALLFMSEEEFAGRCHSEVGA